MTQQQKQAIKEKLNSPELAARRPIIEARRKRNSEQVKLWKKGIRTGKQKLFERSRQGVGPKLLTKRVDKV